MIRTYQMEYRRPRIVNRAWFLNRSIPGFIAFSRKDREGESNDFSIYGFNNLLRGILVDRVGFVLGF